MIIKYMLFIIILLDILVGLIKCLEVNGYKNTISDGEIFNDILRKGENQTYLKRISGFSDFDTNILKRFSRQAGYRYDRPSVSFDLPSRGPGSTLASQAPAVSTISPLQQEEYYAYPVPSQAGQGSSKGPSGPSSSTPSGNSEGYPKKTGGPSVSINNQPSYSSSSPSSGADSYMYQEPSVQIQQSEGSYSYSGPSATPGPTSASPSYSYNQPVSSPSSPAPSIPSSTPGAPYLPPNQPSSKNPEAPYSYNQPTTQAGPSFSPSSTQGSSYLPPRSGSTPSLPSQPPPNSYVPPSNNPMVIIVPDLPQTPGPSTPGSPYLPPRLPPKKPTGFQITPATGKPKPQSNNYVPPEIQISSTSNPIQPSSQYVPQASDTSRFPSTLSPVSVSNSYLAPNSNYGPPSNPSKPPNSYGPAKVPGAPSTPSSISTPASSYLPPFK